MKKSLTLLLLALLALHASLVGQTREDSHTLVFTHVTVINATGAPAKTDMTVVIAGNRITAIGKTGKVLVPDGAQVVDATSKFLIPGLWDMHAHGLQAQGFLPLLIANGITGVRFMGGADLEPVRQRCKEIESGTLLGPRIVMVAPVVDGSKLFRSFAVVITNENEARQAVISLKNQGDFLKLLDTVPREAYFAFADAARRQKIPFVGHLPVYVSAAEAADAGQKSIEHLSGVLLACSAKEAELRKELIEAITKPGVNAPIRIYRPRLGESKPLLDTYSEAKARQLFARFRKNGTWQCPTIVVQKSWVFAEDFANDPRLRYIPLVVRERWKSDARAQPSAGEELEGAKKLFQKYLEVVGEMRRAGVEFLAGSDFGVPYVLPGFSLHDELALLVQAGLTPMEALQSATIKPAKFLGLLDTLGTVEKGKLADLVVLEANPLEDIHNTEKINAVVVNGRLIPKSELQAMLSSVEAEANKK